MNIKISQWRVIGMAATIAATCIFCNAGTIVVSDSPTVVRNAELRELMKQDGTWTDENIAKNPYLFLQEQIRKCDSLKAQMEARKITLTRTGKQAKRSVEEADGAIARYTKFLEAAKTAYNAAEEADSWPATVNGYELDEEQLGDHIADALERIELAKTSRAQNIAIGKKVEIRQGALKARRVNCRICA